MTTFSSARLKWPINRAPFSAPSLIATTTGPGSSVYVIAMDPEGRLIVGGTDALTGLQTITIVAALPFVLVMIGLSVSLVKDLRSDPMMVRRRYAEEAVEAAVIAGVTEHGDDFVIAVDKDPEASGPVAPDLR